MQSTYLRDPLTAWAPGSGYPVLPASQESLAAYLGQLAGQGRKLATLRLHRAAVVKAHRLSGHPSPDGELVATVIKGLGRQFGGPRKESQPLTNTALAAVRATAPMSPAYQGGGNLETSEAAARRGAMDVAIITTMRDGLLRVSEAAALNLGRHSAPAGRVRTDEDTATPQAADRRGRVDVAICAVLRDGLLRRSEAADLRWEDVTFQASGARGSSPRGAPLEDLLALRPAYLDPQAPVFGVSDGQVGRRVRAAALHAGTELTDLQNTGRWQSTSMPARCSRGQRASRGAVARYYGVDG